MYDVIIAFVIEIILITSLGFCFIRNLVLDDDVKRLIRKTNVRIKSLELDIESNQKLVKKLNCTLDNS